MSLLSLTRNCLVPPSDTRNILTALVRLLPSQASMDIGTHTVSKSPFLWSRKKVEKELPIEKMRDVWGIVNFCRKTCVYNEPPPFLHLFQESQKYLIITVYFDTYRVGNCTFLYGTYCGIFPPEDNSKGSIIDLLNLNT